MIKWQGLDTEGKISLLRLKRNILSLNNRLKRIFIMLDKQKNFRIEIKLKIIQVWNQVFLSKIKKSSQVDKLIDRKWWKFFGVLKYLIKYELKCPLLG